MIKKISLLAITIFLLILFSHNVSRNSSPEEIIYIEKFVDKANLSISKNEAQSLSFDEQVDLINQLQKTILELTNYKKQGLPKNNDRSVKSLYEAGHGICYDRSFAYEQILKYLGFEVRHIAIFVDLEDKNFFEELLSKGTPSHAVSEVKTKKGWMLLDSNYNWYALTTDYEPKSLKQIKKENTISWKNPLPKGLKIFYKSNNYIIYGLFSRHGRFFAPYNAIPDYRIQELIFNL